MTISSFRLLLVAVGVLVATPAQAYIGPGLGAGAIATILGVLGAIFVALFGIVYYPIKRRLRTKRASKQRKVQESEGPRGTEEG